MGQAVVILVLIAVLWLGIATVIIGACRVAAQGDAVELPRELPGGHDAIELGVCACGGSTAHLRREREAALLDQD